MITVFGMITILRQPQFFRFIQNSRFIPLLEICTDQCRDRAINSSLSFCFKFPHSPLPLPPGEVPPEGRGRGMCRQFVEECGS